MITESDINEIMNLFENDAENSLSWQAYLARKLNELIDRRNVELSRMVNEIIEHSSSIQGWALELREMLK